MKKLLFLLMFVCLSAQAAFTDLKFSGAQIADTQWNVGSCTSSTSSGCQIYSKSPGPTWNTGSPVYPTSTQYIAFTTSGNSSYPWHMYLYNSDGTLARDLGIGRILSQGTGSDGHHYFFFSNASYNGTLFSTDWGMNNTSGLTITGTMLPTVDQTNTFASSGSTTPLAAGQTAAPAAPSLCCGGSAAQFNASTTNVAKAQAFVNRTTADSQVYVNQIGDYNNITIQQTGTKNNFASHISNGSYNNTTVTQSSTTSTAINYATLTVNGNTNNTTVLQQSTGGTKGAFVSVSDNNNALTLQQKDSGNHYAEVNLSGGNKTVDITQQGSASHMTSVGLTGQPASLSLTQAGSTQQFYSINFNCATAGGCAKITVTQGQ